MVTVPLDDDRPYWQRHYGFPRGHPVDRRSVRRLGWAFVAAVVFVLVVLLAAAAVEALG
jgi:hypothetical protein